MTESANQTFTQALRIETTQAHNFFDVYLDLRLKDTAVFRATRFANNLQEQPTEAIQQEYRNALSLAAIDLTTMLDVDPGFISDPRYAEVFFAICDSWAVNEKRRPLSSSNDEYEREKQFLVKTARVLVGNHSKFKERELFQQLEHTNDAKRSQRLAYVFDEQGQGSLLEKPREKLGITSSDQERAIQIVVPTIRNSEAWTQLAGNAPAFVLDDINEAGDQTLLVGADCYEQALEQDSRFHQNIIRHEWAHTQGEQAAIGANRQLGMILEEERADVCSEGRGHINSKYVLEIMAILLGGNRLNDEFERTIKLNGDISDLYRFISNHYSTKSLLLLMASKPPAYNQLQGIDLIPDIFPESDQRMTDLLKSIFDELRNTDPEMIQKFIDRMRNNLSPQTIYYFYPSTLPSRSTKIPDELRQVVEGIYKEKFGELPKQLKRT